MISAVVKEKLFYMRDWKFKVLQESEGISMFANLVDRWFVAWGVESYD